MFSFFVFLRVFVLSVFAFKTSNQTLVYSSKTCFVVLKTENLFSKQVTKQAPSLSFGCLQNCRFFQCSDI
jgi:hypothetical protein